MTWETLNTIVVGAAALWFLGAWAYMGNCKGACSDEFHNTVPAVIHGRIDHWRNK